MKRNLKKVLKKQKGITLVALVITIVILIILATVAIDFAFGDDGIIKKAQYAKDLSANSTKLEEQSMSNLVGYMNEMLENEGGSGPNNPTLPEGWDGSKVTAVASADGVTVPVPIGYTASSVASEKTVSGGFVIYEGTDAVTDSNVDTAKTTRDQFVWVPVDDISKMAKATSGIDGNGRTNYQGKLYDFTESGATEMTSYGQGTTTDREPDVVTAYDGSDATSDASHFKTAISSTMTAEQFKKQLQEEFNEMVESVNTYGGFYIGRYETGNLASSVGTEPVVVKENNSISGVNWYYQYQNSKLIKANENVVSTMIWGSMWDRTLIWLAEENEVTDGENGKSYAELTNSIYWGNYSGEKLSAGFSDSYMTNNIYDLAGNVYDWTIEAGDTYNRVPRGGNYNNNGNNYPVAYRNYNNPNNNYNNTGFRATLYIK